MRIEFTGRRAEVGPGLRALAERKLKKLEKLLHGISDVHVVLEGDKHRQKAEVSLLSPSLSLSAAKVSTDAGTSLKTVLDKLTRQAQRIRGRRFDESVEGSGLGLAITADIAETYGGELELGRAGLGGLLVTLRLPA